MNQTCNGLKEILHSIGQHIKSFAPVWIIVILLLLSTALAAYGCWHLAKCITIITLIVFLAALWVKPLNIIYGVIGTHGKITTCVAVLVLINVLFSLIYFYGFFQNAYITYDINQPYISYNMKNSPAKKHVFGGDVDTTIIFGKTYIDSLGVSKIDTVGFYTTEKEAVRYQEIDGMMVFRNTLMTSLMQEPTDFFAIACTYNDINDSEQQDIEQVDGYDMDKSSLFHWLLILQVFFSWIFFGVFISILYSKFRYEA